MPGPLRPWVRPVARAGLIAKAAVYFTLGLLAAKAAFGWGGRTTDTRGAIEVLGHQGGALIAILIGVGLLCYAGWRLVEAVADTHHDGSGWKGVGSRTAALGSAAGNVALAATAFGVGAGIRARRSGSVPSWTAWVLDAPVGAALVVLAGVIVLVVGAFQFKKALSADFFENEHIDMSGTTMSSRLWLQRLGRAGLGARGVTFEIIGFFLVRAGLHRAPGEARGADGALRFLRGLEHGDVFLGVVAVGVVAYGAYTLMLARYRRVGP